MKKVKVHKYAGILSAYGLALADAVVEGQEAFLRQLNQGNLFFCRLFYGNFRQQTRIGRKTVKT